jgi:predicted transcriptional regulator
MNDLITIDALEKQISYTEKIHVALFAEDKNTLYKLYPYKRPIAINKTIKQLIESRILKHYPNLTVKVYHHSCSGEVPISVRIAELCIHDY